MLVIGRYYSQLNICQCKKVVSAIRRLQFEYKIFNY